jgi:hypothetical protein
MCIFGFKRALSSVVKLPAELWIQIIEYATADGCTIHGSWPHACADPAINRALLLDFPVKYYMSLSTKHAISLVSRTFRTLVEPYLYDTIVCSDSVTLSEVLVQESDSRPGQTRGSLVHRLFFEQPAEHALSIMNSTSIKQIYRSCTSARTVGIFVWEQSYEVFKALAYLPDWISEIHWNIDSSSLKRSMPSHWSINIRFLELLNCGGQRANLRLPSLETLHISSRVSLDVESAFPSLRDLFIIFQTDISVISPHWFDAIVKNHCTHIETISFDFVPESHFARGSTWPLLPWGLLRYCKKLRAVVYNPLIGDVFERGEAIKSYLPSLTTVGFLLTTPEVRPSHLMHAWNFFRTQDHGEGIENYVIVHYHNNDSCVGPLQALLGYDRRLTFQCRWNCNGTHPGSSLTDIAMAE